MEKIIGRYKVKVLQDESPSSPREDCNLGTMVCYHSRYDLGDKHDYHSKDYYSWNELKKGIETNEKVGVILPIFLMDHSGLSVATKDFNDRWDSGQVGFIYITKEKMLKEYGGKICTKQLKERVKDYLVAEVETYNQYLNGDVYGFEIWKLGKKSGKEKEMIDSCWGYYSETECLDNGILNVPEMV